jgi:hypothetical protein
VDAVCLKPYAVCFPPKPRRFNPVFKGCSLIGLAEVLGDGKLKDLGSFQEDYGVFGKSVILNIYLLFCVFKP